MVDDRAALQRLEELAHGKALLKLASLILYTFPGSPMLYYGDEAGMQGFEDPLNRGTYPWGQEDEACRQVCPPRPAASGYGRCRVCPESS